MWEKNNMIRYSAYQFTNENDITFSPEEYSKFKFGDKDVARKFGFELANGFFKSKVFIDILKNLEKYPTKKIVVMSSPYLHIPTATLAMKDYFVRELNHQLVSLEHVPIMETKIFRASSYKAEYGEMSKEERLEVLKDDFYVDSYLLEDSICLFLDDIVITGAHEHRIKSMLEKQKIKPFMSVFLYYAELTSHETNPVIENYLNYYFVKNLVRLDKIIKNSEFIMNTRVVKYVLDAPPEECKNFLLYQKDSFLHTLYTFALGNRYHLIPDYQTNLKELKKLLREFKLI
jgi:hypothetical protein